MKKNTLTLSLFTILTTFLLTACDGDERTNQILVSSETAQNLNSTLKYTVNQRILKSVTGFQNGIENFQDQADSFCATKNQSNLSSLQNSWKTMAHAWNQLVIYNFGPLNDDIFDFGKKIYYVEPKRQRGADTTDKIRTEIDGKKNSTEIKDSYFDGVNLNKSGLIALEVAIFETIDSAHSQQAQDIISDFNTYPGKCLYLKGMANKMAGIADYVEKGWNDEFKGSTSSYKRIFLDNSFEDDSDNVSILLVSIQEHLDYLKRRKLEGVMDAQLSGIPYELMHSSLEEIELLLEGASSSHFAIIDYMLAADQEQEVETVRQNLADAKTAAKAKNKDDLITALSALDGNFKREIPDALNVSLGINFSDGD